jgi:hypothetical protein
VENMGVSGPGGSDDVCIYFFGSSSNTTKLTLTPEQLDFSVQPKYNGGLIYTYEPDRQLYPPEVSLRVEQGSDVAWNAQRPNWINVTPSSGTTPKDDIKISLSLTPDDAKYVGSRQGQVTFTATNNAQAILQVNVTIDPPRFITPTALIGFLSAWGYTSASTMPNPLPAGAVIFWTKVSPPNNGIVTRTPYAHSTVVLSSAQQIEMARTSHWFAGTPAPNVGTYEFGEIWMPPAGSEVDLATIAQLFPDGGIDREYGTVEAWNCHGFSANVVHRGVNTFIRVQPGTLFNRSGSNTLNVLLGSVWHDGLEGMAVTVPPGVFDVHSQFLVDVFADGSVTFYLFEGSATYISNSGSYQSVLQPEEMVNVDAAGVPGDVTAFDPSDLDRWWEQISIEPASPPLILYLPIILQSSS